MKNKITLRAFLIFAFFCISLFVQAQPSNVWVQKANVGGPGRMWGVGFSIGAKGYMGLGSNGGGTNYNDFWEYDPSTNVWTQKATFTGSTGSSAGSFSVGSKGYLVFANIFEYDPGANTWTMKSGAPVAGFAVVVANKAYIMHWGATQLYEYTPATDTWVAKASFPGGARYYTTGFAIGTKAYFGTGLDISNCCRFNDLWQYDPGTNVWTAKASLPAAARYYAAGFSIVGKGYIGCGNTGGITNDFWEYDPTGDSWTAKATFGGAARAGAVGFSIGTKGYMGNGWNNITTNYTDFWEYTPTCLITPSLVSVTNVSCNGGNNGASTVTATGGTGSLSYSWSPVGGSSASSIPLSAGTYTCTVSDANACAATKTVTVTQPTAIAPSVTSQTSVSCNGGSDASATISASGGTPGYTYNWLPVGGTSVTANSLSAQTYTCTITDANSCVKTQTVTITQPTAVASSVASQTNVSGCFGNSNGAATVSASGGTGVYTYSWAPFGGTTATASGLVAGNYTCTITDANACVKTQTVSIAQPSIVASSVSSQTNVSGCFGNNNGSATVLASGGTPGYTYSWAPSGGTAATENNLIAGTYTCVITDANSCVKVQTVTITQPPAITSSVSSQTNTSCNGGNNGSVSISASGGTGGFTYSWAPSGGTSATEINLAAGSYTCTIKDANNCTHLQSATITQPPAITSSITSQTNISCNTGNDGAASVFASGGTGVLNYLWSPNGATTSNVSNLIAGTYTCAITDANSCVKIQTVTITQPLAINTSVLGQNNVSGCFGQSNGSASVLASGGTGTLNYLWLPSGGNAASAINLPANTYTCYVTDANSCTKTQVVTITQPNAITSSVTFQANVSGCFGQSNGAATVSASGGTGSLTYNWTPSGGTNPTAINLAAGTYTCTITDGNTCTKTQTVTITQPPAIVSFVSMQNNVNGCFGQSNGSAAVSASGGTGVYTYLWSPGGFTTDTINNLSAGNYTCTITDVNGCAKTQTVSITQPSAISSSVASQNNVSGCFGQSNGSASISAAGGTGVLTYSWSPAGGNSPNASSLGAGTYTCTIADANNCTATQTVNINQPPAINSSVTSQTNVYCFGGNNGAASVNASGGTGGLNYLWAPNGSTIPAASNLTAQTYTCTITDINGCVKTQLVTITQPSAITSSVSSQNNVSCSGGTNGSATITAGGGTGTLSYSWAPAGGTTAAAMNLGVGNYTCTITDANSCVKTQTVSVTQIVAVTPDICLVTVDSLAINNIIFWDKTQYNNADSFIVYRYDVVSTTYLRVGAVAYDSLSMLIDTARNVGGPNGGDPQYSSYRYKLAIRDTCGSISPLSPYHQSIFIQQNLQNFSWNAYVIENGPPITGYQFLRDDISMGNWNVLVNTASLSTTDPNYASYPNGSWRVDALGFTCSPTRVLVNTSRSNIRGQAVSLAVKNEIINTEIKIFPNPAKENVTILFSAAMKNILVDVFDVTGRIVLSEKASGNENQLLLNTSSFSEGVYFIRLLSSNGKAMKKLVIEK